ncbi:hypothetical protein [Methanobrevibacter curvatus]|uniref:PIN domain-containing protein n=1 Tax=Methanobrevibacter curvatus TaxID=49547 RepID=A0A166ANS5_9EURY|nr:hypothetical protein [Methanobrevibacter curvatus]KZX12276.1 hypothetical protein MBCUR_11280 [Methanobrevibacter curvatus]
MDSIFLDNNIVIGFCFNAEPQHAFALNIFNHNFNRLWSNNVEYEFQKIYHRKIDKFGDLIFKLIIKIRNERVLTKNELIKIAKHLNIDGFGYYQCSKIISGIWDSFLFENNHFKTNEIISAIKKYEKKFNKLSIKNYTLVFKNLGNAYERILEYPIVESNLKDVVNGKDNLRKLGGDMNICLDAHELGEKIPKLNFCTDDNKFLDNSVIICNHTKIYKIIGIEDYIF